MRVGYRRHEPDGAERGCPALRPSPDPENRAYVKSLFQDIGFPAQGQKAHMLECPDFFPGDGARILLCSPQGLTPRGRHLRNIFENCSIAEA